MFLTELCAELRNYFEVSKHFGNFEISGGQISLDFLKNGQYFRIIGSTFNDGVYQYPADDLTDELFAGAIWAMAVPPAVIALSAEIEEFNNSDAAKPTTYVSESFGGYSYTKATDSDGVPLGWRKVFADRLRKWRKL